MGVQEQEEEEEEERDQEEEAEEGEEEEGERTGVAAERRWQGCASKARRRQ